MELCVKWFGKHRPQFQGVFVGNIFGLIWKCSKKYKVGSKGVECVYKKEEIVKTILG